MNDEEIRDILESDIRKLTADLAACKALLIEARDVLAWMESRDHTKLYERICDAVGKS